MYAIISPRNFEEIEKQYGPAACYVRDGDLHQAFLQVMRVQLDLLIIDLDMPGQMEEELHQYRVQRSSTRIILLAPGREPGDPSVARLVALGVYDIVSESDGLITELMNLIRTPAGYAQAARWSQIGQSYQKFTKKQQQQQVSTQKEVLVQRRPLGLTTIAVAGAGSGAGTSHICLAIAAHLARYNQKVILAEWPSSVQTSQYYPYLAYVGAKDEIRFIQGIDIHVAHIHGFTVFCDARLFRGIEYIFPFVAQGRYEYVILDLGDLSTEKLTEMDRAGLSILVVDGAPYRLEHFKPIADKDDFTIFSPNLPNWRIALNLANDSQMEWFTKNFGKGLGEIVQVPYFSDPTSDECGETIQRLIDPVMPSLSSHGIRKKNVLKTKADFIEKKLLSLIPGR